MNTAVTVLGKLNPSLSGSVADIHIKDRHISIGSKSYEFSKVHGDDITNDDVFSLNKLGNVLDSVIDGFNTAFITIGGCSSGKSYFLFGDGVQPGLGQLSLRTIFSKVRQQSDNKKQFGVTASAIQFSKDNSIDLINPHSREINISIHPKLGLVATGLSELITVNVEEMESLFDQAVLTHIKTKKSGSTFVFSISVYQKLRDKKIGVKSRFQLVEIGAGSEEISSGKKLNDEKAQVAREMPVTIYLKDAFGGNCVTHIFAMLSLSANLTDATHTTAQWAQRFAKMTNSTKINLDENDCLVGELRDQISKLRGRLISKPPMKSEVDRYEQLLVDLELTKQGSWTERQRASDLAEGERRLNLTNKGLMEVLIRSEGKGDSEWIKKIDAIEKEKETIADQLKKQQDKTLNMEFELKAKMKEYSTNIDNNSKRSPEIDKMLNNLNKENDTLRALHLKRLDIEERLDRAKTAHSALGLQLIESLEARRENEMVSMKRREDEHKAILEEQRKKNRANAGSVEVELLTQENGALKSSLTTVYTDYKREIEMLQAANYETFREYRETFESQKLEIERRYRDLLKDALNDAIFLSSRNWELTQENKDLIQAMGKLKDEMSTAK